MSINFCVEKINTRSKTRQMVDEEVAIETPVNLFVNDEYLITLLATPEFRKELALGWLFTEGVLQSIDQITQTNIDNDNIHVTTEQPISEGKLRVVSVSRLLTTACGLSAKKFFLSHYHCPHNLMFFYYSSWFSYFYCSNDYISELGISPSRSS